MSAAAAARDTWIAHPRGRVFARIWPGTAADAPIVLFHDSLGCVELWRGFPAALSHATARAVIAYDRPGFGNSDPLAARPGPGFIAAEARDSLPALLEHFSLRQFIALGHSEIGRAHV